VLLSRSQEAAIPIALVLELWLGGLFALCASARLRADGPWPHPAVLLPVLYAVIVVAPMTAYLYLAHPAWAWLYLVPAERIPGLAVIPAVGAAVAAIVGGWAIVGRLVILGVERRRIVAGLAGGAALVAVLAFVARERLVVVGTHAEVHAGRGLPLFAVKLGYVLVALAIGAACAAVFVAMELRRDARKASGR
jgi:hypothetical protein